VKLLKNASVASKKKPSDTVAIISYDEKPGIQAIATTAPDLPPEPHVHATLARDHEYKRHGTVSLLVLLSQKVAAVVETNHVFGRIHFSACGGLRWVDQDQVTRRCGFRRMSRV